MLHVLCVVAGGCACVCVYVFVCVRSSRQESAVWPEV